MTRPEGFLLVGAILLGLLLDRDLDSEMRSRLTTSAGAAIVLSPLSVLTLYTYRDTLAFDAELVLPIAVGGALIIGAPLAARSRALGSPIGTAVAAICLAGSTACLILLRRDLVSAMLSNWWGNYVLSGRWGWTLLIGFPLAVISALLIFRRDHLRPAATVVLLFPVIGLVTSVLRDTPGRVSDADSFNRMTMHVYPSLLFVLGALLVSVVGQSKVFRVLTASPLRPSPTEAPE